MRRLALALVALLALAGAALAQRAQWPAATVFFTDAETLQEKFDAGGLGGGGTISGSGVTQTADELDDLAIGCSTVPGTVGTCSLYYASATGTLSVNVAGARLVLAPSATLGTVLDLAEGTSNGAHRLRIGAADAASADATCLWNGATFGAGCPLAPPGDWLMARLSGGVTVLDVGEDELDVVTVVNASTQSSGGAVAIVAANYCTGGTNDGTKCPVGNECAGGGTCTNLGAVEIAKAGTWRVDFQTTWRANDDGSGNYKVCSGGTVAGATCIATRDCVGGGTCGGSSSSPANTPDCRIAALKEYGSSGATINYSPAVLAPPGQQFESTLPKSRSQNPRQTGLGVVEVTAPPTQLYFQLDTCGSGTNAHDLTVLLGQTVIFVTELL